MFHCRLNIRMFLLMLILNDFTYCSISVTIGLFLLFLLVVASSFEDALCLFFCFIKQFNFKPILWVTPVTSDMLLTNAYEAIIILKVGYTMLSGKIVMRLCFKSSLQMIRLIYIN